MTQANGRSSLCAKYDGDQHVLALKMPTHNVVAIDCPYTGKGDEFSPASLLGVSLASCMLLSMGVVARREGIDIRNTVVDIRLRGLDGPDPHVDEISLTFDFPDAYGPGDRRKLERAAGLCPIRASIDAGTQVTTTFRYTGRKAAQKKPAIAGF